MSELRIDGKAGSAVPIDTSKAPHPEAGIALWLLHLPDLHPIWDHYALSIITLQDCPDIPKAILKYPEAEFEILFMALDSSKNPKADDISSIIFLTPINYVEQFDGVSSEKAAQVARFMVKAFVDGELYPEPQGIVGARKLFKQILKQALI